MSYANHIWELLEPLGVYQKSGTFQMGEIQTQGAVLDQVDGLLAELEGEMCLATAEDWGLERVASLFRRRPVASTTKRLRQLYPGGHQRHHRRVRRSRPGGGKRRAQ